METLISLRLINCGVPEEVVEQRQSGLVAYLKNNRSELQAIISSILPGREEAKILSKAEETSERTIYQSITNFCRVSSSANWIRWLMFEDDPQTVLEELVKQNASQGVCGAIWGNNDIAYRCRTCEHGPTCAICVPCFKAGNHVNHDYSLFYTGGRRCDCGDETAWKIEGFCSKHRGPGQVQPLPPNYVSSAEPVLSAVLTEWKERLRAAERRSEGKPKKWESQSRRERVAYMTTATIVRMLLSFCRASESLLNFTATMVRSSRGLLAIMLRSEQFLYEKVVAALHELLLKLLGEPDFKRKFAKAFIRHYRTVISQAIQEGTDGTNSNAKYIDYLGDFSVEIFRVPTLTLPLVTESSLLDNLLENLRKLFKQCAGKDEMLLASKVLIAKPLYMRLVKDIGCVMSHLEVAKYVARERCDLSRRWIQLLVFMHGMDPPKRVTSIHAEEENDHWRLSCWLGIQMADIHVLFVTGAASINDTDPNIDPVPAAISWLITECIEVLDSWLSISTANDLMKPPPLTMNSNSSNSIRSSSGLDTNTSSSRGGICRHCIASHAEPEADDDRIGRAINTVNRSSIFGLQEWPIISYDVSRHDVSFHIPLHRLLSLSLYQAIVMYTSEHELPEIKRENLSMSLAGSCHEFFRQLLGNFHPYSFSAFVMEYPLRLQVFCAQVRAGMWPDNGHSTSALCEYYHSVRGPQDTDLFLLQCCASIAPPEPFVCGILDRFGLSNYLSLDHIRPTEYGFVRKYNPFLRYKPTLTQEMLALIIRIVAERGFCGLPATESLKRELIRKLSVGDATRSQLLKALPPGLSDNKDLQKILDTVANFFHTAGMQQGKYSLRKDFWKELDLYHPRWNSRELKIAEERYYCFYIASAMVMQLPSWRKPFYPLENIWQIATSKVVLQIIRSVVFYAAFSDRSSDSRATDEVLFTALHLLALGLDICSSMPDQKIHLKNREIAVHGSRNNSQSEKNEAMLMDSTNFHDEHDSPPILAYANETIDVGSTDRPEISNHQSLLSLLVLLMQKYESGNEQGNSMDSSQCSIAVLIRNLLEKFARLHRGCLHEIEKLSPSIVLRGTKISEVPFNLSDAGRKRALERRDAVMVKMKAEQAKFAANQGMSFGEEEEASEGTSSVVCPVCGALLSKGPTAFLTLVQKSRLLSFAHKGTPAWDRPHLNVGKDDSGIEDDNGNGNAEGPKRYIAAIRKVMSKQQKDPKNQSEVHSSKSSVSCSPETTFDGFGPSDCDGIHVSSCGHAVHQECIDRYLSSLRPGYSSRIVFGGVHIVDPSQDEFRCPVCRQLANSILPVLPDGHSSAMPQILPYGESSMTSSTGFKGLLLEKALSLLKNAEEMTRKQEYLKAEQEYHKAVWCCIPESAKVAIESLSQKLYTLYLPSKCISKAESARINQSLVLWDVLKHSLLAVELAARSSNPGAIAGGSATSLEVLHSAVYSTRGSVLSLIFQVAKATQRQNRLTVLLRSKGIQLLVGSISCGVSRDPSLTGNISSLLEHIKKGKDCPDIQFWKRMADPVLIHDPFSSFVWLLFCLPTPLPRAIGPFISLVHIFYVVCLFQAIAYAGKSIFPVSNLKSGSHSLVKRISTVFSGTGLSKIYSEEGDADLLLVPTELLIRRLTLPYLRRCALLYKLLYPSSDHLNEADDAEKSTQHIGKDCVDKKYDMLNDLEELQRLEKLFQLPALETILEDKNVDALGLSWCQHLARETGTRTYKHVVRCLRARPFELMILPHLYHDLLQRYIKERCPVCKTVPDEPALCLLCGTLCCAPSCRDCCSQHECIRHAMSCGAGVGVFLLIRRTTILLQQSTRQAERPSPYMDAFGEEDYNLERGKPLYLSRERYAALTQMVVSHGLKI